MRIFAILCYYAILCVKGGANRLLSGYIRIGSYLVVTMFVFLRSHLILRIGISPLVIMCILALVLYLWRQKAVYI